MKLAAGLFAMMLLVSFTSTARITPYQWFPVTGLKSSESKYYFDPQSVVPSDNLNSGLILTVFNEIITAKTEKGPIPLNSMISHLLIDCKSGMIAISTDLYFGSKFPTKKDAPLAIHQYKSIKDTLTRISKQDPLFKTLCPAPI